jgi:glycosyltransferase involved in cell wall biosynthesis
MKISVLIHNLNRGAALEQCLSSVVKQTYRPLEAVILDAGSTDASLTVIHQACESMHHAGIEATVVPCPKMGVAASRNLAAGQATGDLLCFIDNDAAFTSSDGLCHVAKLFGSSLRLGMVSFRVFRADTDAIDPVGWVYRRPLAIWSGREFHTFILNGTGFCARANAFWEAGGFWDHLEYSREEEDMGLALVDRGWELLYTPAVSIRHYSEPIGRMSLADRRATELRNGILVLWRRVPIILALFAVAGRICTMACMARRERSSVRLLIGAVPQAFKDWRQSDLRRLPVTLRSIGRYAALHLPAKQDEREVADCEAGRPV